VDTSYVIFILLGRGRGDARRKKEREGTSHATLNPMADRVFTLPGDREEGGGERRRRNRTPRDQKISAVLLADDLAPGEEGEEGGGEGKCRPRSRRSALLTFP